MKTIKVTASTEYDVLIGNGLLSALGQYISARKRVCKVALISDSNVAPLHMNAAIDSLKEAGFDVVTYTFQAGEASKNGATYLDILDFLARNNLIRSDLLIALGGGVVGDMTGFVAATYLRGISFVQIPTTLLAMVDSSVGGKTAIDLPSGKNLAGAFYQPTLVVCDLDTLTTLPENVFRDGCAEVLKYGILYDRSLFSHLLSYGITFDREYVIARCVELKMHVVCEDEFDTGSRQKLNLGHTIGHGIEAVSGYAVSHGNAVAIGSATIAKVAVSLGYLSDETYRNILTALQAFSLPVKTNYTADALLPYILGDKKRSGDTINLIIPYDIGDCRICKIPVNELKSLIEAGL